ncbi:aldehyde dehydrogenase family protein [Paenibacillus agilis]|uniref:Aldehyde dehydrogenase family protein n=1 Tax=Paenibacillus agilis TaxID=3020863 RepID=A0A559IWH0_9BACL|nr:aldehyde dehydrogenase family protein [Paenibacillus agilis]TVX91988.1 aldehyde dehydrogenase family protein [Paenibacillus agilis]
MTHLTKHLWINGQWTETQTYYELHAPYDRQLIANIAKADASHVQVAIDGAHRAASVMRARPAYERAAILAKVALLLQARREEMARLCAMEAGKPIRAARAEIDRTITTYQFAAEEAKRIYGETIPMDAAPGGSNRLGMTWREPLGIVVAITPFNFPFNLVAHKLGPAFAAGNTVVLKPANQTPLSALAIAELFDEAGLPAGALHVLTGSGRELSDELLRDERVRKVTFTGSPEVGKAIKSKAGLRKVTLELGSNSALIIEPDTNIPNIIERCVDGAFAYAGQVCISLQRIYVHEHVYDEFCERFIAQTAQLRVGDPLEEETDISTMIHTHEVDRIEEWVQEAIAQGARIGCGGQRDGSAWEPTVLLDVTPEMSVSCKETFAPVVSIVKYRELDDAIALTNDSAYGLNIGIYTSNIDRAFYAARALEAGAVIINDIPTFRLDHMPYGGVKDSGYGREGVKYAVEEMTELKFVSIRLNT